MPNIDETIDRLNQCIHLNNQLNPYLQRSEATTILTELIAEAKNQATARADALAAELKTTQRRLASKQEDMTDILAELAKVKEQYAICKANIGSNPLGHQKTKPEG